MAQYQDVSFAVNQYFGVFSSDLPTVEESFMDYPTVAEVVAANREQVSFWWHFLPEPKTPVEERVLSLVFKKFCANGGLIEPELRELKVRR